MTSHVFKDESASFLRRPAEDEQNRRHSEGSGETPRRASPRIAGGKGKATRRQPASAGGSSKGSQSPDPDGSSHRVPALRFVTTTDPTQFKDRSTMRGNRSHVMYNHLKQRNQRSPSASPSEVSRSPRSGRSKDARLTHERSPSGFSETLDVPSSGESHAGFVPDESSRASQSHSPQSSFLLGPLSEQFVEDWDPASFEQLPPFTNYYSASFAAVASPADFPLLVHPRRSSQSQRLIDLAFQNYAPFKPLDSAIAPFRSLPAVDADLLKFHYNNFFGTKAMEGQWIPLVVGTRVAFMSSVCLATVHMDAMNSSLPESYEAAASKLEVMHLINKSMGDVNDVASDPIIVAAVQLVLCELVNMEDTVAVSHSGGVERMVHLRGGLHKLGMNGQLAGVVTAASFLTAVLCETQPSHLYQSYFSGTQLLSISPSHGIPESPLFCPRADFYTLVRSPSCRKHTFELLSDLRDLTELFLAAEQYTSGQTLIFDDAGEYEHGREVNAMQRMRISSRILGLPSSADPNGAGEAFFGDWTYEACRLAALIYVHGLSARSLMSSSIGTAAAASASTSGAMLLWTLRDALARSDVSECWGDMAGVLLWVTLVGATAARGVSEPDLLATKKWMTALAVRCTLLLAFEHEQPLLGSLGKMLTVNGFCSSIEEPPTSFRHGL